MIRPLLLCAALGALAAADGASPKSGGADVSGKAPPLPPPAATPAAAGAFRDGGGPRLDGSTREPLLERLRRLDRELAAARDTLAARESEIAELRRLAALADEQIQRAETRVRGLELARGSLENARQEVSDRGRRLELLTDQLAQSELARLRAEQLAYEMASDVLKLEPGDGPGLTDLQLRVRRRLDANAAAGTQP